MYSIIYALLKIYVPLSLGLIYGLTVKPDEHGSKVISSIVINILFPFLLFTSIYGRVLVQGSLLTLTAVASVVVTTFVFYLATKKPEYTLVAMKPNAGYLPIPIAYSVWGTEGVTYVAFYMLGSVTTSNVLAPLLIREPLKKSLRRLMKFPPLYAILAALLATAFSLQIPEDVERLICEVGEAAPILAILLLGIDFSREMKFNPRDLSIYFSRVAISLTLTAIVATIYRISSVPLYVLLLEAFSSPAISNVALANELGMDAKEVAKIVMGLTIFVSVVVLPVFLIVLQVIS